LPCLRSFVTGGGKVVFLFFGKETIVAGITR
jgi:hypothetical protein